MIHQWKGCEKERKTDWKEKEKLKRSQSYWRDWKRWSGREGGREGRKEGHYFLSFLNKSLEVFFVEIVVSIDLIAAQKSWFSYSWAVLEYIKAYVSVWKCEQRGEGWGKNLVWLEIYSTVRKPTSMSSKQVNWDYWNSKKLNRTRISLRYKSM